MRNIVLAAMLAISPMTAALAQGTTTGSGMTGDSTTAVKNGAADPHKAGATGSKVVPGTQSSVAGNHKATVETKQGHTAGGK